MKSIIGFLLYFSFSATLIAQIDSVPIGKVIYIQRVEVLGDIQKNGYSTLLFNNVNSIYVHNSAPTSDSSYVDKNSNYQVSLSGDKEGFPIYKRHSEKKIFSKIVCREDHKEHCIVSDTFTDINWKLYPEHKRFGQYDCRRATGIFRGREYEVWYAPDIPVPSGPFKLGGLPGLILEAASLDGNVKFTFSKLEISNKVSGSIRFPSGLDLSINETVYEKNQQSYRDNLVKEAAAKGIDMSVTRMETIEIW